MDQAEMKERTSEALRILILENVPADAEMMERELNNSGIAFTSNCVYKKDDFLKQLEAFSPDIILSDYSMPQFNGMEALALTRELNPTLPFVMVTGSINEETAVECMKAGADDYVLKERLKHVGPAVEGALAKKRMRGEKERAEDRLQEEKEFMEKSLDAQTDTFIVFEPATGKAVRWNKAFGEISGYSDEEIVSMKVPDSYYSKEDLNNAAAAGLTVF
jgi:CheY-like chemotaxis protein